MDSSLEEPQIIELTSSMYGIDVMARLTMVTLWLRS